jgi:hypothetical protein
MVNNKNEKTSVINYGGFFLTVKIRALFFMLADSRIG